MGLLNMDAAGKFLSSVRRATASIQSATTTHSELTMAIYSQKCVARSLEMVVHQEQYAARSMTEWAANEDNVAIQAIYVKLAELRQLQNQVLTCYSTQHMNQRKAFKNILSQEKGLEHLRKLEEMHKAKVIKLTKQLSSCQAARKVDRTKVKTIEAELDKEIIQSEASTSAVEKTEKKLQGFKFMRIKDSICDMTEASRKFHKQSLQLLEAEDQLRELLMPIKHASHLEETPTTAHMDAANILRELAQAMSLEQPKCMVEKNSQLEHVIQSDRMLKNDPIYVPLPEKEISDVATARRPLPLPPMHNSDVSDNDEDDYEYAKPYGYAPPKKLSAKPNGKQDLEAGVADGNAHYIDLSPRNSVDERRDKGTNCLEEPDERSATYEPIWPAKENCSAHDTKLQSRLPEDSPMYDNAKPRAESDGL